MIKVRKSEDRGRFQFGWLDTRHTFSFGDYHDPHYMGFSDLRVINEDQVVQGGPRRAKSYCLTFTDFKRYSFRRQKD